MENISELMNKEEPLRPELKKYLERHDTLGHVLRHPLVFGVPYFEQMNAVYNRSYEVKSEYLNEKLREKDWFGALALTERPYRFELMMKIHEKMHDGDYWEALSWLWIDSENIWQNKAGWIDLLRSNRPGSLMNEDEQEEFKQLPEKITIYRGCIKGLNEEGISWTMDSKVASKFTNRFRKKPEVGLVKKKVLKKSDVYAYINSRSEREIIILPK